MNCNLFERILFFSPKVTGYGRFNIGWRTDHGSVFYTLLNAPQKDLFLPSGFHG